MVTFGIDDSGMCETQACITVITHFPMYSLTYRRHSRLLKGVSD